MMAVEDSRSIGVFDSGIGGLSVLKAIWQELPHEQTIYLADQAHVPYGPRPLEQVRGFSVGITRFLLEQGSKIIVVACNAASAAALHYLRAAFPEVPFVGMEPAVKPAVEYTRSGVVGVLATPATFQGALYASVVERFAAGVELLQNTCPGLVMQIEAGELESPATKAILHRAIFPMLDRGIDTIVLGCTHYPLVIPLIQEIAGPQVRVIDPAPAVARQVRRLLEQYDLLDHHASGSFLTGSLKDNLYNDIQHNAQFYTTSNPELMRDFLNRFFGTSDDVKNVSWNNEENQISVLQ
jgi:glutamate racemase